jgi:hypothetical protein
VLREELRKGKNWKEMERRRIERKGREIGGKEREDRKGREGN